MERLSVETFVGGSRDFETKQYEVLHCLKEYYAEFFHNRLYPAFKDLVDVTLALENLLEKKEGMEESFPQHIAGYDLSTNHLIYDSLNTGDPGLVRVVDLIVWALPLLKRALEEGASIYHFVEEHLSIEEVGIMPVYKHEGYWAVPDTKKGLLHLLRYEVSLFSSANERYRQLKTRVVQTLDLPAVRRPAEAIKMEMINRYRDLPNPAMYMCETDLDFPYESTILPVAKRKLMVHLSTSIS